MKNPISFCIISGILCASLYLFSTPSKFNPYLSLKLYIQSQSQGKAMSQSQQQQQPEWSSPYSGYLHRAQPHPTPHAYVPQHKLLKLIGLRNAPAEPEGFSLALFADRVAVDAKGNVVTLAERDFNGLAQLAEKVQTLPETGDFRNQWRVRWDVTGRAIERILYRRAEKSGDEFGETSVYGFDKHKVALQKPVGGYETLPAALWELTGLVLEARDAPGEKDEVVLKKVRDILGSVF